MARKLGNNAVTVREKNIALIVKLINKYRICSRADLAAETGLTQASITYITKELIDWELIYETGVMEGKTKHPSIGLAINRKKYNILGVQINRDYVRAGLFSMDGVALEEISSEFSYAAPPRDIMDAMHSCIDRLLNLVTDDIKLVAIGVALPGPFLPAKGKIELMSGAPGWNDIDISGELSDRYHLPVVLEHDANCGALAELWYGKMETKKNILFVNVADGIGAGIICNGRLYRGQIGIAGEIGHMCLNFTGPRCECGNRGCLELYCSLEKLKADYDEIMFAGGESESGAVTAEQILRLAGNGDANAIRALEKSASFLGIGLANIVNVLDPGTIILSDKFAYAGEALVNIVRANMKKYLLRDIAESVDVRLSSEPREDIMLRGAAVAAMEYLLKIPSQYFGNKE